MDRSGRRLKVHVSDTMHHVMVRGNNRQKIFFGAEYYKVFLQFVSEAAHKFNCSVLAYCLMTNHVHLIVYVQEHSLSKIMQNICYRYVRWVHKKLSRIGHLFQGRYHSILVDDEAYLINLCRYIHLNPVEARMVKSLHEYPWSSHLYYVFCNAPLWLQPEIVKQTIKKKTGLGYHRFMGETQDRRLWEPALFIDNANNLVINDSIINKERARIDAAENAQGIKYLTLHQIVAVVAQETGLETSVLISSERNHTVSRARAFVVYFAEKYSGEKLTDIAKFLKRAASTITHLRAKASDSKDEENFLNIAERLNRLLK